MPTRSIHSAANSFLCGAGTSVRATLTRSAKSRIGRSQCHHDDHRAQPTASTAGSCGVTAFRSAGRSHRRWPQRGALLRAGGVLLCDLRHTGYRLDDLFDAACHSPLERVEPVERAGPNEVERAQYQDREDVRSENDHRLRGGPKRQSPNRLQRRRCRGLHRRAISSPRGPIRTIASRAALHV